MPNLIDKIIELEEEVKKYKLFVVKYERQIQNITDNNVQRVLTPEEIKKMYALKDDLYFKLRNKGYKGKVTELESAIETRKQNDIKIIDNFQKAVQEYFESPHIKSVDDPSKIDLKKIDKEKAKQLLKTSQKYKAVAESYNNSKLMGHLSSPINIFELYFSKLEEEKQQRIKDREYSSKLREERQQRILEKRVTKMNDPLGLEATMRYKEKIVTMKDKIEDRIKRSAEYGLLYDVGNFVKEHYKGVIGTAAGLSAAGLAVYFGMKHVSEIAKIGKPVLLSLPYLGLGGVTCWRAANEGPQVFAITFASTLGFTIGGPYLIPMIPFLPDMSPATCAYLGGLAGGFGATILDMFGFFQ